MKKGLLFACLLAFTAALSACGNAENDAKSELEQNDTQKAEAKVDGTSQSSEKKEEKEEDIWTYYDNATATDEWEGLKFEIQKVATTDKFDAENSIDDDATKDAVAVKFKVENTTEDTVYNTYPDQAILSTSTGEQIDLVNSDTDSLGGKINEGVIKEGQVIWNLQRGHVSDIKWIKIQWDSDYEDPNGNYDNDKYKEHSIKIDLPQ